MTLTVQINCRATRNACYILFLATALSAALAAQVYQGQGCTTAYHIDKDCDGYGVGTSPNDPNPLLGPDADDNDASVQTTSQFISKWGSLTAGLAHLGYTPLRQWFISTTGNDATCVVNNASLPCATFAQVKTNLLAGDAVLWRAGTYTTGPDVSGMSGTSNSPIILMAYPGEVVLISNTGAISMVGSSYVTIDGFRIASSTGLGYGINGGAGTDGTVNSYGITIRNIEGWNWYDTFILMNGLQNYLIEQNVSRDTTAEHCMYLGSDSLPSANVTVRHNLCYRLAENGIKFNGRVTNLVVDSNISHSNGSSGIDLSEGVANSFITNNLVFQSAGVGIHLYNYFNTGCDIIPPTNICPHDENNNTFENNTVFQGAYDWHGTGIGGIPFGIGNEPGFPGDMPPSAFNQGNQIFRNNIFYSQTSAPPIFFQEQNQGYSLAYALDNSTYTDNVIYYSGSSTVAGYSIWNGSATVETDYTCSGLAAVATVAGCINSDPLFTAISTWNTPGLFNFIPKAGSPAVSAGTATGAPAIDIVGVPRTNPPDIGAYQDQPPTFSPCDLNQDGVVNVIDVQLAVEMVWGSQPCPMSSCTITLYNAVLAAALPGGSCTLQ